MLSLLFTLLTLPASAAVSCSGELNVPGGFVSGNCAGASCSAFLGSQPLGANAECDTGVTADVQGNGSGGYVSGNCAGGSLSLALPSETISLQGTCSTGRLFSGTAQAMGGYASGSCTQNGSFSVFISSRTVSFRGGCE